jgi:ribonuclease HII
MRSPQQDLFSQDLRPRPDFFLEDQALAEGHTVVAGIDEVGRGPWAGPVVAAAVVLDRAKLDDNIARCLNDSKKLSMRLREELFTALPGFAWIGIGMASVEEIDRLNILNASLAAMARAVSALDIRPDFALVDGNHGPDLPCPLRCVVQGDARSLSIAAASVMAKVTRDRMMADLAAAFPGYGWERNAGYGTAQHRSGLERLGVTEHHRRSFAPILKILRQTGG